MPRRHIRGETNGVTDIPRRRITEGITVVTNRAEIFPSRRSTTLRLRACSIVFANLKQSPHAPRNAKPQCSRQATKSNAKKRRSSLCGKIFATWTDPQRRRNSNKLYSFSLSLDAEEMNDPVLSEMIRRTMVEATALGERNNRN